MKNCLSEMRMIALILGVLIIMPIAVKAQPVLEVKDDKVGIGTDGAIPNAKLEVRSSSGDAKFLVHETSANGGAELFELRNNGAPFFVFKNEAIGQSYSFFMDGNGNWKLSHQQTLGVQFTLSPIGNLTIPGTLRTGGPQCGGGCDRLFQAAVDGELESIEEHSAFMWENRHLKEVGPTVEGQPINLTEKTGGILSELEKAHIYIEQLHERLSVKEAQYEELLERLTALEEAVR